MFGEVQMVVNALMDVEPTAKSDIYVFPGAGPGAGQVVAGGGRVDELGGRLNAFCHMIAALSLYIYV